MKYKVFAHHAHIFPESTRPEGTVQRLKEYLEDCEIEKAVCFAPFQRHFDMHNVKGEPNDFLAESIANEKNLYGFGTIDFNRDDIEEQVDRLMEMGFYGIKVHPAYQQINVMSEKAQRLYAKAQDMDIFLSFHTGIHWHRIADYTMLLYDELAFKYPKVRFSMEHLGGYHFFREGLAVMENNSKNEIQNTFSGWTSINMTDDGLYDSWSLSDLDLRTLVFQEGCYRHFFGLDFPYRDTEYTKKAINRIINLEISDEAKEHILGKNIARELKIPF